MMWWRGVERIIQDILWNNNLLFYKYWLIHYVNIPEYPIMALITLFGTGVIHQLSVGGWCPERFKPYTQSVLYLYYILSREKSFEFFKDSVKQLG